MRDIALEQLILRTGDPTRSTLAALAKYDLSFLQQEIGPGASGDNFPLDVGVRELRRYFALVALEVSPLGMFSYAIDTLWHRFIAYSAGYRSFCTRVFGGMVDHQPNTPRTPVPKCALKNFIDAYEHEFGVLPAIWFDSASRVAIERYCSAPAEEPAPVQWSGWTGSIVRDTDTKRYRLGGPS